jgi:hypothetical protein
LKLHPKDADVSFEDFGKRLSGQKIEKPKTEKKVEGEESTGEELETPKDSQKSPEATDKVVETKAATTRNDVLKSLGIPESEYPLYKGMHNDQFNNIKAKIEKLNNLTKENADLKTKQGQNTIPLYGNPQGYLLDPQHDRLSKATNIATSVVNHWIDQLDAAERGEKWLDLDVDKDGNLIVVENEKEPSEQAKSYIRRELRGAEKHQTEFQGQLNNLRSTHENRYKADLEVMKAAEDKYFPGYDDPNHPTAKTQQATIDLIPEAFRHSPVAKMLGKTVANNLIFKTQLEAANKELTTLKAELEKLKAGRPANPQQPTKNRLQSVNGQPTTPDITYDMFNKRIAGHLK